MSTHKKAAAYELIIGLILVFFYIWGVNPLKAIWFDIVYIGSLLLLFLYSEKKRWAGFQPLGFRFDTFIASGKVILVGTLIMIVLLSLIWSAFFPVNPNFYKEGKFWEKLFTYPLWALLQQSLVLIFFFRRLRDLFNFPSVAIFLSAVIFSCLHLFTPPLVILCFIAGLFWSWAYHKIPNMFTIALSHGILGTLCSSFLLMNTQVGPNAEHFRWSDVQSSEVYFHLDTLNGQIISSDKLIIIDSSANDIVITGWVVGINEKVQKVVFDLNDRDYETDYGIRRPGVARHYDNQEYLFSGMICRIPMADLTAGTYSVQLKVLLENHAGYHVPYDEVKFTIR